MAVDHQMDIALAPPKGTSPAAITGAAVRQRRGWLRRMYSPLGVAEQGAAATAVDCQVGPDMDDGTARNPRRGGWLRRRWKLLRGASSRLATRLPRWKRTQGLSVAGGWASELLDAAAFRVMYVVEAVVLGLALSCFFCCCGCQI